ncbi:hypothetical protein A2J03_17600 [Rhodococcus sp. EPR-157]|nr:hypothetical protein A2J03_17600 [Rhodococcus sp. EPR-157]
MFDEREARSRPEPRRLLEPPRPVFVRVGEVFGRTPFPHYQHLPIRARLGGLKIDGVIEGSLYAWIQTTQGDWLGLCEFELPTGDGTESFQLRQWCPSGAISLRSVGGG